MPSSSIRPFRHLARREQSPESLVLLALFPYSRVIVLVPILLYRSFLEVYAFVLIGIGIAIQVVQGLTILPLLSSREEGGGLHGGAYRGFAGGLSSPK